MWAGNRAELARRKSSNLKGLVTAEFTSAPMATRRLTEKQNKKHNPASVYIKSSMDRTQYLHSDRPKGTKVKELREGEREREREAEMEGKKKTDKIPHTLINKSTGKTTWQPSLY